MTQVLQSIKSEDLPIAAVFQSFYEVPSYQREYVWGSEQVEQLLEDVNTEFASASGEPTEYFIGSIVALAKDGQTFELIDGQQRMTTLFLILCALRERLKELGEGVPEPLTQQIAASSMNDEGDSLHRFRVELQYEDSQGILRTIGAGEPLALGITPTRSVENILNAYSTALEFLRNECPDAQTTRKLYAFLVNRVKLIRVQTASIAHALKVFETINDRGVGLDSMDLLKNLLFMNAKASQFEELKGIWKGMVDALHAGGEKPLRFLRYLIFADYDVERLREEGIYAWLRDHETETGYKSDPLGFARRLRDAAQAYVQFATGKNADGTSNRYLENLRYLSGAAHQQLILLMAARKLPQDAFVHLSRELENLFFAYIITREPTKNFEQAFAKWSQPLRKVQSEEELQVFLDAHFLPAKQALAGRYSLAFNELNQFSVQQYRMRYILAKLVQYVDVIAMGEYGAAKDLLNYINKGIEIEHILPQTPTQAIQESFDDMAAYDQHVRRLGNLTLLEKSINSAVGNSLFSEKQAPYRKSTMLLTKSLGEDISVGKATAYERAAQHLESFKGWTSADIKTRQEMLRKLAFLVWDMPKPAEQKSAADSGTVI